jgi:uncharacterized protein with HEPN domain
MGMRDVLSHHYFDLNADVVYSVCQRDLPAPQHEVDLMLSDPRDQAT